MDSRSIPRSPRSCAWGLAALLTLTAQVVSPALAQSGYQIVVNDDNPLTSLTKWELSQIFLGKRDTWPSGQLMRPVDQTPDREVRDRFSKDVHNRHVPAIKNYWQRQIFSGRGIPPPELRTEEEVLAYVRGNSGAIGYVSSGTQLGPGLKRLRLE